MAMSNSQMQRKQNIFTHRSIDMSNKFGHSKLHKMYIALGLNITYISVINRGQSYIAENTMLQCYSHYMTTLCIMCMAE
jgi:hypothetical protein